MIVELKTGGSLCTLKILDDGRGFTEPTREGSLGMRLLKNLSRQLRAQLSIDGSAGTRIELEWAARGG